MHWLIRGNRAGGHVHVGVWCGTETQAASRARPKLGTLIMDPDQWAEFQDLIQGDHPLGLDAELTVEDPA